jgi:L-amino acid N-acyltransferase YncA
MPSNQGAFMHVRRATAADAERIAEIYNWYILNTIITFEADVVSPRGNDETYSEKS